MTTPAIWYFDVISPYAYLALYKLDAIRAHREVILKPVVFGAVLKAWGQLGPAEVAPKRAHMYRQIVFEAHQAGLPICIPAVHPFPPLPVLRLLTALDGNRAAVETAFHLVWGEGRNPTEPDVLEKIAEAGGNPAALTDIATDSTKAKLHAATAEAVANGAFGVPTLAIDNEIFWGADAVPIARAYLDNPALFSGPDYAQLASVSVGVVRRR